ncbi:MAG: ATP-dependent helicase [Kiritimatiellia bacterium]
MLDLSSFLNPEQFEAATAPDGPLLILAAAGTGKTRTLVYRVVHLLDRGFNANEILLLTFTNRAASEMLTRVNEVARNQSGRLWGGTFHSIANRILRRHSACIGFPGNFKILDSSDQETLMGQCIREAGHKSSREFPKRERLLSFLSGAVNRCVPIPEYLNSLETPPDVPPEKILDVLQRYMAKKQEVGGMDFDDLLVNLLRLLHDDERILDFYQDRFRHILVDEYQDTNTLQSRIVDLLAARHRNLSVVGDDYQCIYSWRGSNYRNIMDFTTRYPDAKVVKLERNYRSRAPILELANASILHNAEQFHKQLRPVRNDLQSEADRPTLFRVAEGKAQAAKIVEIVKHHLAAGTPPNQIAVLYRSHFNAVDTQMALAHAHIPFRITSGTGFYELAHIKDMVSFFRLTALGKDPLAFRRVFSLLPAIGEMTAQKLCKRFCDSYSASASEEEKNALLEALPAKARAAWTPVDAAIRAYTKKSFPANVKPLFQAFLDAFYRKELQTQYENCGEREDEINQLATTICEQTSPEAFLEELALMTNLDTSSANQEKCILLSTVHQAKGLEWSVVMIPWMVDDCFPSGRSVAESNDDSEERRLFYVAVTRARDSLYLLQPSFRAVPGGECIPCEPSRFIAEVPQNLLTVIGKAARRIETNRFGDFDFSYGLSGSTYHGRSSYRSGRNIDLKGWGWK